MIAVVTKHLQKSAQKRVQRDPLSAESSVYKDDFSPTRSCFTQSKESIDAQPQAEGLKISSLVSSPQ